MKKCFAHILAASWISLSKICALYPRMCSSHTAVVKALLLNPLIFKQCAPATLTQNHQLSLPLHPRPGIILKKVCLSVETRALSKCTLTYLKLKGGYYYHMNAGGIFLNTKRQDVKHESEPDLVHALQTVVANFEPLDDFHLNLHEFDILNLLTSISTSKKTLENKQQQPSCKYIRRMKNSQLLFAVLYVEIQHQ